MVYLSNVLIFHSVVFSEHCSVYALFKEFICFVYPLEFIHSILFIVVYFIASASLF